MTAIERIAQYCISHLDTEPLPTRITLYRDLAQVYPDEKTSRQMAALAAKLEDALALQLTLDLPIPPASRHGSDGPAS